MSRKKKEDNVKNDNVYAVGKKLNSMADLRRLRAEKAVRDAENQKKLQAKIAEKKKIDKSVPPLFYANEAKWKELNFE